MLRLPHRIEVELASAEQARAPVPGVLVALDLLHSGRHYFGTLLGLTDAAGRVRIERDEIAADFAEHRRLFPADYRVPLDECDPVLGIVVPGGAEFLERRAQPRPPLGKAESGALWDAARNARFRSVRREIRIGEVPPEVASVRLTLEPSDAAEPRPTA